MLRSFVVLCLVLASPAWAEVIPFSGSDPMTDATYSGVRITSVDGQASINFICDSGRPNPRVMFNNERFLGGKFFELAYRIDKKKMQSHAFWTYPNHKSGSLYAMYFDVVSEDDKRKARNLGLWEGAPARFVDDFVGGTSALVRVWDYNRQDYTYKFNLAGLAENLDALRDCYPRP